MSTKLAPARRPLSPKERAFVLAYRGPARGNATQAAIAAGYAPGSAAVTGWQLLRKPKIAAELAKRVEAAEQQGKATAEERDLVLSRLARDPKENTLNRILAIKELNKVDGRHTVRHQIEGKITLEEALAASREG